CRDVRSQGLRKMRRRWLCVSPGGCSEGRAGAGGKEEGADVEGADVEGLLRPLGVGAGVATRPGGRAAGPPGAGGFPGARAFVPSTLPDAPVATAGGDWPGGERAAAAGAVAAAAALGAVAALGCTLATSGSICTDRFKRRSSPGCRAPTPTTWRITCSPRSLLMSSTMQYSHGSAFCR